MFFASLMGYVQYKKAQNKSLLLEVAIPPK